MTRRSFTDQVFSRLPRTNFLRRVAEIYTLYYYGSFGWEMETNGELNFMRYYFSSNVGAVVFDVGANIGKWSTQVLNINPNLHIHAFEPTPATYAELQSKLAGKPVTLNQCAMGAQQGEAAMLVRGTSTTNSLVGNTEGQHLAESVQVKVDTLDAYCARNQIETIDYLKIDVEGYEMEVMLGAESLLSSGQIGLIHFEYGDQWMNARRYLRDAFDLCRKHRYQLYKFYPKHVMQVPKYDSHYETFRVTYWLAVSPKMIEAVAPYARKG